MRSPRNPLLALVGVALCMLAPAQTTPDGAPVRASAAVASLSPPARLRVGLVLSGGGARGAAHIGVLKMLDRLHVPIDAIAGTSMGAVVGGLYASGLTGEQVERAVTSLDWQEAFRDRPDRSDLNFRRKQEELQYEVNLPLGLHGKRLLIPKGLIQGQRLTEALRILTLPVAQVRTFDQLPTPFRAVATDLETGKPVVFADGDLTMAMRASMSAPGAFAPVEYRGQLLVDGGLVDNLPVDIARSMNVDVLIVVDADLPLQARSTLETIGGITNQMITILLRQETARQMGLLGPQDVVVTPQLGPFSSYDFSQTQKIVAAGEEAARAEQSRLDSLSISEADYAQYVERRATRRMGLPKIDFVRVDAQSKRYQQQIQEMFGSLVGQTLNPKRISERMQLLYGRGDLEMLDFHLVPDEAVGAPGAQGSNAVAATPPADSAQPERFGTEFSARRKSWGPDYLRFGLQLQDNFEGDSTFDASVRMDFTELNSVGAESDWDAQIGSAPRLATELYLPFSNLTRLFVAPHAQFEAHDVAQIEDNRQIGNFRVRSFDYGLDFGTELQNWGEMRVGAVDSNGTTHVDIGDYSVLPSTFDVKQYFVRLSIDQMDHANFPREGQALTTQLRMEQGGGGERGSNQLTFDWRVAHSWGGNTLMAWASYGSTIGGSDTNVRTFFPLGGFLDLTGLRAASLAGPQFAIGRLIYLRKIGNGGEGVLDVPGYIGVSAEVGNVWSERNAMSLQSAHRDFSVFFGADTYIGPAYLAVGYDETGSTALYLFIGHSL